LINFVALHTLYGILMQMFLIQFETYNVVIGIEVDHGPTVIALQTTWHFKDDKARIDIIFHCGDQ
jgi:hypothetical protein